MQLYLIALAYCSDWTCYFVSTSANKVFLWQGNLNFGSSFQVEIKNIKLLANDVRTRETQAVYKNTRSLKGHICLPLLIQNPAIWIVNITICKIRIQYGHNSIVFSLYPDTVNIQKFKVTLRQLGKMFLIHHNYAFSVCPMIWK